MGSRSRSDSDMNWNELVVVRKPLPEATTGCARVWPGVGVETPSAGNSNSSGRSVDATSVGDKGADGIGVGGWMN